MKPQIIKTADRDVKSTNLKILQYLKLEKVKIQEHADGCRINLDKLTQTQLTAIRLIQDTNTEIDDI